jgi:hypothetical protein
VAGSCEHGNEPLGSTNDLEFLDQQTNYQLLKTLLQRVTISRTYSSDVGDKKSRLNFGAQTYWKAAPCKNGIL